MAGSVTLLCSQRPVKTGFKFGNSIENQRKNCLNISLKLNCTIEARI